MQLRPYQLDMVQRTREAFRKFRRNALIGSTGCGKSVIAAYMGRGAFDKGNQTWFLAHRTEIVNQLRRTVEKAGVPCGIVGEDYTDQPCLVGNIHTVVNRLNDLPKPSFIFADECHRSAGATFSTILEHHRSAHLLGLTATPQRLDGRGLDAHFQNMVLGPSMKWLIGNGYLKQPVYFAPKELVDVSGLRRTGGDYDLGQLEKLMAKSSVTGDMVTNYKARASGRIALVFCVTVKHAEAVAAAFCESGIPAESIDGKLSPDERQGRLTRLATGETVVMASCSLIEEGFDLESAIVVKNPRVVSCVIGGSPTYSITKFMQRGGRAVRIGEFEDSIYLDHAGDVFRHGFLEDDREWSLEGRPRGRSQEPAIEVHRCEECYAVFQGGECSQCGAKRAQSPREIAAKEGELRQIFEVAQKINHKAEERACNSLADWQDLAQKRGWKPQAAYMRWNCSWKSKVGRKIKA